MNNHADILITHAHLFSMRGNGMGYLPDAAVAIRGNRIIAVDSTARLEGTIQSGSIVNATGKILLPGLIDAHMHTHWAVIRGVAQDIHHWMQKGLAPFTPHLTRESRRAGTSLALIEAIRAGTTTFGDYCWPEPGWAEQFIDAGVRARLTPNINALPENKMSEWEIGALYPLDEKKGRRAIEEATRFADDYTGAANGRIGVMLGPQGPDMISRDQLLEVKMAAEKRGLMIHMHTAQGDREINQMMGRYGKRTPQYLKEIGYLDDQLLTVHLTEATEEEAAMIARSGSAMALCSGSIGIIDGIVPPAHAFRQAGGNVALGSDQAPGNNCHNIFNEMKLTALFNKIRYRDPTVLPAWEALRMATIEGARAIGLGDEIGSIEVGKKADLILVDATQPNILPVLQTPVRTMVPNLVYAANGSEVSDSMVDGKWIMQNRKIVTINEEVVFSEVQLEADLISGRMEIDQNVSDLILRDWQDQGML